MRAVRSQNRRRFQHCRSAFKCLRSWRGDYGRLLAGLAILVLLTTPSWSQAAPKKRVAVFDFDNAAIQSGVNGPYFQTRAPDLGKGVSELLIAKLVQDGNVSVVERNAIGKILAEQNLASSDRTDPVSAARLGRLLGVDAIILGTITHYDYDEKIRGGGASRIFGGLGGGASPSAKYDIRAKVQISTRLVSPDTAEVMAASEGIGETSRKGVRMDLRDMGGRLIMASGVNNPVITESLDKAIAQLANQLEPELARLPRRAPLIEGLVADASEAGQLVLNVGARNGVRVGDHLQVLRSGKEIRDPATGKVLMRNDTLLGEAIVTTVNDVSSIARYDGAEPAKVSDIVKSLPKQR